MNNQITTKQLYVLAKRLVSLTSDSPSAEYMDWWALQKPKVLLGKLMKLNKDQASFMISKIGDWETLLGLMKAL